MSYPLDEILEKVRNSSYFYRMNLCSSRLCELKIDDIQLVFKNIPNSISSLWLADNNLANLAVDDLTKVLASIPASVTLLSLRSNNLGNLAGDDLAKAIASIPTSVTTLDLSHNYLGNLVGDDLAKAIASVPNSVTSLYLDNNNLGNLAGDDLVKALASIPKSVTFLSLNFNNLRNLTIDDLEKAFSSIPKSVTEIRILGMNLENLPKQDVKDALTKLPLTIKKLWLASNDIEKNLSEEEVCEAFGALLIRGAKIYYGSEGNQNSYFQEYSKLIYTLNATDVVININSLYKLTPRLREHFFNILPQDISHVKLRKQIYDADFYVKVFASIFKKLPASVSSLDLSNNTLHILSGHELAHAFAQITPSIKTINLNQNQLSTLDYRELGQAFQALPKNITTIILNSDSFNHLAKENFMELLSSIPDTIRYIDINFANIPQNLSCEAYGFLLGKIPNNVTRIDLSGVNIDNFTNEEIIKLLNSIPKTVTTITPPNLPAATSRKTTGVLRVLSNIYQDGGDIDLKSLNLSDPSLRVILPCLFKFIRRSSSCIDLRDNDLGKFTNDELSTLLRAIPLSVKKILLDDNKLFGDIKTFPAKDARQLVIQNSRPQTFFSTSGNEYMSPALLTFIHSCHQQRMPYNALQNILTFLLRADIQERALTFFFGLTNNNPVRTKHLIQRRVVANNCGENVENSTAAKTEQLQFLLDNYDPMTILINTIDKTAKETNCDAFVKEIKKIRDFAIETINKYAKERPNETTVNLFKDFTTKVVNKSKEVLGVEHIFVRALRDILNILTFIIGIGAHNMQQNKKLNDSFFHLSSKKAKLCDGIKNQSLQIMTS